MTAKQLDGKQLAQPLLQAMTEEIRQLKREGLRTPGLAVILVGEDPASQIYVRKKQEACEQVGIHSSLHHLSSETKQSALADLIQQCNEDPQIDGILLQLPLPSTINATAMIDLISPTKDVDGFHPYNLGCLAAQRPTFRPCTPAGIMHLLAQTQTPLRGINALVVGASNIVGRPMALELLNAEATVTIAHQYTKNLKEHVQNAELLVVGIGNPKVIQTEWIQAGAIVIDVGINRLANGKIVGDIDFPTASKKAAWITPVPGGVGPMTVATLLQNTLKAYKNIQASHCPQT